MSQAVYDVMELGSLDNFVYDVKVLYQLRGDKFNTFSELCSSYLSADTMLPYIQLRNRIRAHLRSYIECGIAISNRTLEELTPKHILVSINEEKDNLTQLLFDRFNGEDVFGFYETFFPKLQALHQISSNLDLKFNFVGTKNGRLSFKRNTFNPYVLPKTRRDCIAARPGYKIWQFDIKSSQPRMAIFSTTDSNFKEKFRTIDDVYSIFPGDRQRNKVCFLRWMYGNGTGFPALDEQFERLAHPVKLLRQVIYEDVRSGGTVFNRFSRPLYFGHEPENVVFQNYITSTEADALFEIVHKMHQFLKGTHSRILFPFYDAVICEIAEGEPRLPGQLKNLIQTIYSDHVFFCNFPVEAKSGYNFAELHL